MVELEHITPNWSGDPCIVAAPGPSLSAAVVRRLRFACWLQGWRLIAVQDAYRVLPFASAVYGCNPSWWRLHGDCGGHRGELWSTHEAGPDAAHDNDKSDARQYGVHLVRGRIGDGFSTDPAVIHYGSNSGFQAINLAVLKGCKRIVLCGFDMRQVAGRSHFFGEHPPAFGSPTDYSQFLPAFERAAKQLPEGVEIINATPGSALRCFAMMTLDDALALGSRANLLRRA